MIRKKFKQRGDGLGRARYAAARTSRGSRICSTSSPSQPGGRSTSWRGSTTAPATDSSRRTSARPSSSSSRRSRSATASCAPTRGSCGGCSRSERRRHARRRRRRSSRCTSEWGSSRPREAGLRPRRRSSRSRSSRASLHYTDAEPVAVFLVSAAALGGLAWAVGVATESVGARFGPAVTGVLQSTLGNLPGALHRPLRAHRRRGRGRTDLDHRLAVRERAARARLRDRRRRPRARGRHDALRRPAAERHRDAPAAGRLHHRRCSGSPIRSATARAAPGRDLGRSEPSVLSVYAVWLWSYLRTPGEEPAIEEPSHGCLLLRAGVVILAAAGVGAAFVSDWFVAHSTPPWRRSGSRRRSPGS